METQMLLARNGTMVDKLHGYQGFLGRLHTLREGTRAQWNNWRDENCECREGNGRGFPLGLFSRKTPKKEHQQNSPSGSDVTDYSHICRRKTRSELIRISSAVMGIEFSYAAETAFVSPILLKIGVQHEHMTLVWGLSPIVGFFVTPILGSLSDRCSLSWGRRRPFILILAIGILSGLLLVPNGEDIGYALGDYYPSREQASNHTAPSGNWTDSDNGTLVSDSNYSHPWSVFFTILGTVLLDFDADACQSPSRAYLLDVTLPEDHALGLSTFTVMAGLGGCLGYALGAINWDVTAVGEMLGGHVRAVFTLITFIFTICVAFTITSFREIPLRILEQREQISKSTDEVEGTKMEGEVETGTYGTVADTNHNQSQRVNQDPYRPIEGQDAPGNGHVNYGYDESYHQQVTIAETSFSRPDIKESMSSSTVKPSAATFMQYLLSIVYMPGSLRILCVTNLFCWSAHVCYSLYFTDFVGEAVFEGDPKAADGTLERELYEEGVRFGCWGMSMYSLSCAFYSLIIERLIKKFRARNVYVSGLLLDSLGMLMMAVTKNRYAVIVFSAAAGVMYSTLFTMPYLLVAHYHASGRFELTSDREARTQLRGLGTDVAIVSSMVFLAQFILSMCMGSIVSIFGTTTTVVSAAAVLSLFGAIAATQVMYLEL